MRMKSTNSLTGYRQVITGFLYLPRRKVVDWIRTRKLSPSQLGNYIISLVSADWDKTANRTGVIRYTDQQLSTIWNLNSSTFSKTRHKLVKSGFLMNENGCMRINDFNCFTRKGSSQFVNRLSDNELSALFPLLGCNRSTNEKFHQNDEDVPKLNDNCHQNEANVNTFFKIPLKKDFKQSKKLIIRQERRSMEEYEEIYMNGQYQRLILEDMKWIDENATEEIEILDEETEKHVVQMYFNNDWTEYERSLIAN